MRHARLTVGCLLLVAGCRGGSDGKDESRSRRAVPTAAPQASAAPAVEAPKAPPPPPEPVPERLGTPASSQAKRPAWSRYREDYAPQPESRDKLFNESSGPLQGEQVGLVCRLGISTENHGHSNLGAFDGMADLSAAVSLTQGKEVVKLDALGPEDTKEMWFTVPLVKPEKGAKLRVASRDRDFLSSEPIESLQATFDGSYPLTAKGRVSQLECRPLGRAVVERHLEIARIAADEAHAVMAAPRPDPLVPSFDVQRPKDQIEGAVRWKLDDMAGLVGWDDPRVVRRVERLVEQQLRMVSELGGATEAMRQKLPPSADGLTPMAEGALAARVTSYACGPDVAKKYNRAVSDRTRDEFRARPCVLGIDVVNRTGAPIEVDGSTDTIGPLGDLTMLSPTGAQFDVEIFGEVREGKVRRLEYEQRAIVPDGATVSLVAHPVGKEELSAFAPPLLLRGMHAGRRTSKPREWLSVAGGSIELRATDLTCRDKDCELRVQLRPTGNARFLKIGGFVHEIEEPPMKLMLLDPSTFNLPKPEKGKGDSGRALEEDVTKLLFRPFATVEGGVLQRIENDLEVTTPGQTVEVAFEMDGAPLPGGMDLDKLVLDKLVLETSFDPLPSFLRVEPPPAP
ncbi:hypothetical protein [Polyangium aurulentum]|uniref:hypothetical protein n=1 Tax=Polyangium aurulentum TaxID=2567896 RepID=UPI0010AE708E|nr:hypothetical protein [Polyangium aurulentum]UQA56447.1 hypothetical protein E8A73_034805 [Polyangium aurulentum]